MASIKIITYDQLHDIMSSVKTYIDGKPASKLATPINMQIGNKSKSFDGSSDISWSLSEMGAFSSSGGFVSGWIDCSLDDNTSSVTTNSYRLTKTFSDLGLREGWFDVDEEGVYMHNDHCEKHIMITHDGVLKYNDNEILHAGNFSSYLLNPTGSIELQNNKFINALTTDGTTRSILGLASSDNVLVGNYNNHLTLRSVDTPTVYMGPEKSYEVFHSGNHVIKDHGGQTTGKDNPLGTIYTKMYNSESSSHSYITRVTAMYNSDNKEDFASFGLFNPAGDGSTVNYINVYADRVFTKGYYRSSDDFIILGGHRLTINSDEPSTKTKGDIWIQI